MTIVVWLLLLLVLGTFTWLLLHKGIDTAKFLAVCTVWIAFALIVLIGPETIGEIVIGSVTIKRDVRAAREIRDQVEQLASDVQTASEAIKDAQQQISSQRDEIAEASERIKEAEENVRRTAINLRAAVEAVVDTTYLSIATRNRFPIPKQVSERMEQRLNALANFARPDEAARKEWIREMEGILKDSRPQE